MARPARRNGMKHMWRHYVPGAKYKRRKHSCRCLFCCSRTSANRPRGAAKRRAIEEQV